MEPGTEILSFSSVLAKNEVQFLTLMGHELRTMLNAIVGMSQIMQTSKKLTANELKDCITSIHQTGTDLIKLLDELLDFTQLDQGQISIEKHSIDFSQLLTHTIRAFSISAKEKGIAIKVDYTTDAPQIVYGDAQRIRQILHHLLENALKFTDKGEIIVSVMRGFDSSINQDCLKVSIRDTGIGIAAEKLPHVFDKFTQLYSTNDENYNKGYRGLGLGLTVVKQLVELHGGQIIINSQIDKGTMVTFTLPTLSLDSLIPSSSLKACRILLIDEHAARRHILTKELELKNIACESTSLQQASHVLLDAQKHQPFQIVLVVADKIDQHVAYFARTLRGNAQLKQILLVLALSTETYDYEKEQALISGYSCIVDTIQPMLLTEQLSTIWESWSKKGGFTMLTNQLRTKKVLVVEDNLINQKVAKLMLTEIGCDVEVVGNGTTALQALSENNYAIIFIDIGLPDISGLEVIAQIRQREDEKRHLPIVVLTADGLLGDKETVKSKGIDAYLVKPLDIQELREAVNQFLPASSAA